MSDPELIAIIGLAVTTIASVVAAAYAMGGLPRRSEFNQLRGEFNQLRGEFNELRKEVNEQGRELNAKIDASHKELSDKIDASHKELSDKIDKSHQDLLVEIRRSHQQVMRALINHRHLEPDGEPVFTEPTDTELVAADN